MFAEDDSIFLADFGVPVVVPGRPAGSGIYDAPGEYIGPAGEIQQSDPVVRCLATLVLGLEYGDSVTVDGLSYTVRDNVALFDGRWRRLYLSGPVGAPVVGDRLLLEDGSFLLLEDGGYILLEV